METEGCPGCEDLLWITATFEAKPAGGTFEYNGLKAERFSFDKNTNTAKIEGDPKELEGIIAYLVYHPACISDKSN